MRHVINGICVLALLAAGCGGSSGSTAPDPPHVASTAVPVIKVYSSTSAAGPWGTSQVVTVTGHGARLLIDPSPVLMPNGTLLLYYVMAYDDALTNVPSIGVAQSTDGVTFTHKAVAWNGSNLSDPFPMLLDASGTIRLLWSQKDPMVYSTTATDTTGLSFSSTADSGRRATNGGVTGVVKIGSTYYMYVTSSGQKMNYLTSSDGLNFAPAGTLSLSGESPSPINAGGGTYLMTYTCGGYSDATTQVSCIASSTNGITWTQVAQIGPGGVPGLVKDASGTLRVYVQGL